MNYLPFRRIGTITLNLCLDRASYIASNWNWRVYVWYTLVGVYLSILGLKFFCWFIKGIFYVYYESITQVSNIDESHSITNVAAVVSDARGAMTA